MKRIMSGIAVGAMVLGSIAAFGVTTASAATTTPTVVLSGGSAVFGISPGTITATASVAGAVSFTAGGVAITGCTAAPTATVTPFIALCTWTPSAAGPIALGATFTPTDTTDFGPATAATFNVIVGSPVQGTTPNPISLYVDTIVASGSTGVLAPEFGAGCEITSEFIVGQTIVFRVYGNDSALGGAVLTPLNVSTATVTIPGVATPLALAYGNHGGAAFWTAPLKTGTTTGLYDTLGIISYKVTFNTIAVPAVTKKVTATKLVPLLRNGKHVIKNHKVVMHRVSYTKTVVVTPAVAGGVGSFTSNFNPLSQPTLNAVPAA
jgi:hypothetical protein